MSGEGYIEGRSVLHISTVMTDEGKGIRSKNKPSIGETSENFLDPDRTWYMFSNLILVVVYLERETYGSWWNEVTLRELPIQRFTASALFPIPSVSPKSIYGNVHIPKASSIHLTSGSIKSCNFSNCGWESGRGGER